MPDLPVPHHLTVFATVTIPAGKLTAGDALRIAVRGAAHLVTVTARTMQPVDQEESDAWWD